MRTLRFQTHRHRPMKRTALSPVTPPGLLAACVVGWLCLPDVVSAETSAADSVHFCVPFDYEQWRRDHPLPAAKRAADLNVGEPRTVRMIYFLPNDRPYRAEVVQDMKDRMREVQGFYSASMRARGHGDRTFRFETDAAGEPMVHRVDGQHADSHYLEDTFGKVLDQVEQTFDIERNVYLAVIDISTDVIDRLAGGIGISNGKIGGFGLVTSDEMDPFNFHNVVSHELGHAFGLYHDFRDDRNVMSYGNWEESGLSACNAGFLAVNPHFNADIPIEAGSSPAIERTSPLTYPKEAKSVSIQLDVSDAEGLHQVILFVKRRQVKACRELAGRTQAGVAFDYNGVIPDDVSWGVYTSLADPPWHPIFVRTVDREGNASDTEFFLEAEESESTLPAPHRLVKISGDNQRGETGSLLANPLVVQVRDQYDNPLPGAQVTFSVHAGEGSLSGRFSIENVTTDADGRAELVLTLGPGAGANEVKVSVGEYTETFRAEGQGEPAGPPSMSGSFQTWHLPEGATLRLGSGKIEKNDRAVAFSPDGQLLAVARNNGIWLYDTETYGPIAFLPAEERVASMSFSPDGTLLAWSQRFSYETPETVKVWDLAAGQLTAEIYYPELWAIAVAFSRDGTLLAIGGGLTNDVFLFDTETWRQVAEYPGIGASSSLDEPFSISFSPDGRLLAAAAGSSDRAIGLWDVTTHTKVATLEGHTYPVASTSFSPDGSILASGSWDRTIKLWDVATHEAVATLEGHTDRVLSVTFSEDGTTLASASSDGAVKVWDVARKENAASLQGDGIAVGSVTFSPDGILASGYIDGSVKFWDVSARGVVRELGGSVATTSAAFSGDGRILAMGSDDKTIKIWEMETGTWTGSLEGHTSAVASVAFLGDGKTLVTGAYQEIKLWHAPTRQGSFSLKAEYFRRGCQIYYIVPSPDGTKIASGGPFEIVLWDPETREQTATAASTTTLSFSPDGEELVTKSFDGFIDLWDAATLQKTETIPIGHVSVDTGGGFVLFSPDGKLLATGTDYVSAGHIVGSVKLWDAVTKEKVATFEYEDTGQIRSGAFSPDGSLLAAGSFYGKIRLLDVENRKRVATLEGHAGSVESLSFSHDGRVLASGSTDGTVLLWDMELVLPHPATLSKLSGIEQQGPAGTVLPQPFVVAVLDQHGDPISGATVTFALTTGEGTLSVTTATTDSSGRTSTTLTLGRAPGTYTVEATLAGLAPVTFTATGLAIPETMDKLSGQEQEGAAGAALGEPFVVEVRDQVGNPLAGATVTFAVSAGGGTLSATTATTDSSGRASTTLTLGRTPGMNTVRATVAGLQSVAFSATGLAVPGTLAKLSGDEQEAEAGAQLAEPLVVSVRDQNGAALPGAVVTFAVLGDGGTLSAATDTTDDGGLAGTTLTLGEELGTYYSVEATVAGLAPVTFTATGQATADFDGDGETGFSDFFLFADAFGGSDPRFDLDGSGSVDFADFFLLADYFADPARGKLLALAREMIGLPDGPQLRQNAPNPFNSETVISWFQLRPGPARLEVFALTGQRVAVLHEGPKRAGFHRLRWDARDDHGLPLASGVYVYRLVTAEAAQTRKLTLLR